MSKSLRRAVLMVILSTVGLTATFAQNNNFWQDVSESSFTKTESQKKLIVPAVFRSLKLNTQALLDALKSAPTEFTTAAQSSPLILSLPMPDGSMSRFAVVYSPMMEPGLQSEFPNIRTYNGQGIDDPSATLKMDWTEFGFHAQIRSASNENAFYIDPYVQGETTQYISYHKKDLPVKTHLEEGVIVEQVQNLGGLAQRTDAGLCLGATLRTYRLAVACTGQYAAAVGATTVAQALSAIVTTVNRVNGIFESELSVRLTLVSNNNLIVFLNTTTPFSSYANNTATCGGCSSEAQTLINRSQKVIDSLIGNSNYDIGHTFSTGAGGLAQSPAVCLSSGKARGVTGSPTPTGDGYDVDFVAHEMGHQLGGSHTFNSEIGGCGDGNRSSVAGTRVEPGSGITIMGYAGLCNSDNLAFNSIPYFHAASQNQIGTYVTASAGSTCGTLINTGNAIPVVNAGADYVIPKGTPFMLTGSATDANSTEVLTYSWEEFDDGGFVGSSWNSGNKPFFRSFAPNPHPYRSFPLLSSVVNNTTVTGEFLPTTAQTLNFRLTARDNRAGGAGICSDDMVVVVNGTAGPFQVTSQWGAETWTAGATATISWDVAGTNVAPVNATNVSISFSADGGLTFPYTILASTANDGTETITVPSIKTTKGRIMIKGVNNIFYNVNSANITINTSCAAEGAIVSPANTVTALSGTSGLNLNLNPQYGLSGTLNSSTPTSGTIALHNNSTSACSPYSNPTPYVTYPFTVTQAGNYTFNFTGTGGIVLNIYSNSFTPGSCTNYLGSNVGVTGSTPSYRTLTVALNPATPYVLVVQFIGTLPASYTSITATSNPAGGSLNVNGVYNNPGAGFSYSYVVVKNSTNNIVSIGTSDLSNSSTFPPGQYTVYGLSHASSIANLSSYVGQSLTNLLTQIQNNPTTFCASLSKNSVTVNVTGTFPVQFTALKARKNGDKVNLDWGTATEQNSSHFIVQRSANGTEFNTEIGRVQAAGNSTAQLNYRHDDVAPLKGWNYYRIKQVDLDGKFTYSNIAAVNFAKENSLMVLYPNPTKDVLNIEYTSERSGKLELQVIDSKGAVMIKQNMSVATGRNLETINVSMLSQGMYILRYQEADGSVSFTKFVKQ